MVMKVVNIYEAKAKLSECLDAVAAGERVLICKRNQPVAELRAVPANRVQPRPIGKAAGRVVVPTAFFDPLPADVADAFDGTEEPARPEGRPARLAKATPAYRVRRSRGRAT
jgi:antitoxin (DNA-binding transcriptional repressor) of toxin-antitoxin stability system